MASNKPSSIPLSKSRFMAGLQCLKRLYFQVHQPGLAAEADQSASAILKSGEEVGELARRAFPGGVLAETGTNQPSEAVRRTQKLFSNDGIPAVFEGTFQHDNILVRTDVLARRPHGGWRLIEVKSSTEVKEHYPYDVGIQHYVLEGLHLKTVPCLMHLNRNYVYNGREHDLNNFFLISNLAGEVNKLLDQLPEMIRQQRAVLSQQDPPAIAPGPQCKSPVRCEFYSYCNPELPEDHVSLLPAISSTKLGQLAAKGITSVRDIPPDFPLSERQRHACRCIKEQTLYIGKGLNESFEALDYPLFFMDFETLAPAVPRFSGMRPYDPIPFQWSVHIRANPGGPVTHHEFLAEDSSDPRSPFLTSLLEVVGHEGHVIVYNQGFESQRLAELAGWLPWYAGPIAQLRARLWDLLAVVRKSVYHPAFRGSFSLKRVLPALVPEMTYEGMEVSEGEEAGLAWERMVRGQTGQQEHARLRKALLEYCCQDTLAMVRLLDRLAAASSAIGDQLSTDSQ